MTGFSRFGVTGIKVLKTAILEAKILILQVWGENTFNVTRCDLHNYYYFLFIYLYGFNRKVAQLLNFHIFTAVNLRKLLSIIIDIYE